MACVLAMMYLVLFSTLAIGFYASTATSMQVTANDERVAKAFMATESGLDFMRYQLANVHISADTTPEKVLGALYAELKYQLEGTANLGENTVGLNGNTISIPAKADARIALDKSGEASFRVTITEWAGEIVVKVDGRYGGTEGASRAITMDFTRTERVPTVFDSAVATKGQLVNQKGTLTSTVGVKPNIVSVLSTSPSHGAVKISGGSVGGDVYHVEGATAVITGGMIGGVSNLTKIYADHVHEVEAPEFPVVDTSAYAAYATNKYVPGVKVQQNIRIPAGTNPKFGGGDVIQGIMYIESPNTVTISGSFELQGFVVFAGGSNDSDKLEFTGSSFTMSAVPGDTKFDSLRSISGVAILAPTADVMMTGNSGGNIKGSIIADTFSWKGSAALHIDQGTLMTLDPGSNSVVFDSSDTIQWTSTGANNRPNLGVKYSSYFLPKPATYQEVAP
jgi:hypothetical protein